MDGGFAQARVAPGMQPKIVGFVDGIADGALSGWVANLDKPGELGQVVVIGENGLSRDCRAFVPRMDVNTVLHMPGRFGFAIPLPVLDGLGQTVRVTDANGAMLTYGDAVRLPTPAPGPGPGTGAVTAPSRPWVVLHIQKTAGTSIRGVLAEAMGPGRSVFLYNDGSSGISQEELFAIPPQQRAAFRLVIGHIYFGAVPPPAVQGVPHHATILRHPVARLRSHYHHHVRASTVFEIDGPRHDVAAVVSGGLTDEFDNLMVRMVAGLGPDQVPLGAVDATHVDQALDTIRAHFRFVALTERLDEHFPRLCAAMGIAAKSLPRENVGRVNAPAPPNDRVDWRAVLHRNRFDAMLYDRVQRDGLCGRDLAKPAPRAAAVAGVRPPS